VSDTAVAAYSGLLPAVLAGQVPRERMEIDLVRLCAAAGARLVVGEGTGVDTDRREVHVAGQAPVPFDLLSIGIGSVPASPGVTASDGVFIPIKPMWSLLDRLRARLLGLDPCREIRVVIVGGGAGGVEIALCLPGFVRAACDGVAPAITLVDANERLLAGSASRAARLARETLERRDVRLALGRRVITVGRGEVLFDDGTSMGADLVLWATGAVAPPVLAGLGLPTDERGFLLTRATLQSLGDDSVFAVGDSGTLRDAPTPKAGVFAVRQGPVLRENLSRKLRGLPLEDYAPQRRFLRLLNTGDGRAIAEYRGIALRGRWPRWLKERIDSSFMRQFQEA
jgi:selenide,water dikinase